MDGYKALIECICSERSLIDVFNFLNAVFHKDIYSQNKLSLVPTFAFHLSELGEEKQQHKGTSPEINLSNMKRFLGFGQNDLDRTQIVLTITVEDDTDLDIFTYRYFFLILNKLLRKQDLAYLDCPDIYYHKVGSYFFLQTLSQAPVEVRQRKDGGKSKKLPQDFSLSSEWLPAIYLCNRNSELYKVLANPLFNSMDELKTALQSHSNKGSRLYFAQYEKLREKPLREQYTFCLKHYFMGWLNGMISESKVTERLQSAPGIAQLLFALLCRKIRGYNRQLSWRDAEMLLDICFDFGDCILQVAENIVSHTEGGVLSVRINDNWEKIRHLFQPKNPEKARWYMRISLVDYSHRSILDNVKAKSGIEGLTLSHIFMDPKVINGMPHQKYQRTAEAYEKYLNGSEQIIHHYGLAVFRDIVSQYGGCFTVKSSTQSRITNEESYAPESVSIAYHGKEQNIPHIPGSEYDILLPLDKEFLEKQRQPSNPSVLLKPKYIVSSVHREVVFENDTSNHFNGPLSYVVHTAVSADTLGYQQMKEQVIKQSAQILADKLLAKGSEKIKNSVFYFYLSDIAERVFGRTEIVAKIILQVIAELKAKMGWQNNEQDWMCLVLYGFSENRLVQFARQFALFYHRSRGNHLMQGCQLYAVSENYQAEVLFAGVRLSVISDYCRSRRLVTGASLGISDLLTRIASREMTVAGDWEEIEPFPFDLLARMERVEHPQDREQIMLSRHNKWYHKNLETVLQNDIHSGDLGCCLRRVHVRVGNVHLNTFYEGQLLFANLYWYQIFAHYICDTLLADNKLDGTEDILLYGYETYSEQMLFAATQKLREKGRRVYYAVFENPKYITAAELSEQRVRYLEKLLDTPVQRLCVVYLYGIGTTLTTISQKMNVQLEYAFQKSGKKELLDQAYKKGIVIVQVSDKNRFQCDRENHTVSGQEGDLDFLTNGVCNYLIEIQTDWNRAEECPLCLRANSYLDEQPLIQTNETSTVPMILIKPNQDKASKIKFNQDGDYTPSFLQNPDSAEYLYYCHLNRAGNHYQFYIRTAALLNDYLQREDKQLRAWFQEIREKEMVDVRGKKSARIDIIVSPQHFSNESLVAAVNDRVFGGEAYIINFDVKKEFRDSFVAKFQNYRSALDMLHHDGGNVELSLNFYYVDDIIMTGSTFNRARSLISSMLGEYSMQTRGNNSGISINLFKGIILLVNRNSKQTMCNYFVSADLKRDENGCLLLPVYAFINLNTPAIRSYGDSCPICNKLARIHTLEKESSLTYVERHWREKSQYHRLKKLSDAKADKLERDNEHRDDEFYRTRGLRRMQCSEAIWALLKTNSISSKNVLDILENEINRYLCRLSRTDEKVEYLISFLKIISREHIVFQETIQPAALRILLTLFSIFIEEDGGPDRALYQTVRTIVQDLEHPELAYTLYLIIIARLCTMGSTVFCRREQLEACLETGLILEERVLRMKGNCFEPFSEFLCIQIKKMLFITQDCAIRVEELQHILKQCIQDELRKDGGVVEEKA